MFDPSLLSRARTRAGLTQADLARTLNLAPSHISRVEHGRANLSLEQLVRWLEACGLHLAAVVEQDVNAALARVSTEDHEFLVTLITTWADLPEEHRTQLRAVFSAILSAWMAKKL